MNELIAPPIPDKPTLAAFSPQGFAVNVMELVNQQVAHETAEVDAAPGLLSSPRSCPFPPDLPLCSTFMAERQQRGVQGQDTLTPLRSAFVVRGGDAARFKSWMVANPHVAELFTAPHSMMMVDTRMKAFKALPDEVFRKVIRGDWITDAQAARITKY